MPTWVHHHDRSLTSQWELMEPLYRHEGIPQPLSPAQFCPQPPPLSAVLFSAVLVVALQLAPLLSAQMLQGEMWTEACCKGQTSDLAPCISGTSYSLSCPSVMRTIFRASCRICAYLDAVGYSRRCVSRFHP